MNALLGLNHIRNFEHVFYASALDYSSIFLLQRKLDDLVDKGYVHRSDITDHIMQALEGRQTHVGLQHCKQLLYYECDKEEGC